MSADDIRVRLEAISEELADLALDRLREALAADTAPENDAPEDGRRRRRGGPQADEERRLTRARRAVDNAVAILAASGDR